MYGIPGTNGESEWSPILIRPQLGYAFVAGCEVCAERISDRPLV